MTKQSQQLDADDDDKDDTAKGDVLIFDKDKTNMYDWYAKQHFHKDGPLRIMIDRVVLDYHEKKKKKKDDMKMKDVDKEQHRSKYVVLDLASGPGEPAASIAKALPSDDSIIYSTDISINMNEKATQLTSSIPTLITSILDMTDLKPLFSNNDCVDVITCNLGIMFPKNKIKALEEVYRVLKWDGIYLVTNAIRMPHYQLYLSLRKHILAYIIGSDISNFPYNPLEIAESNQLIKLLNHVGFCNNIERIESKYTLNFSNDPIFFWNSMLFFDFDLKIQSLNEVDTQNAKKILFNNIIPQYLDIDPNDGSWYTNDFTFECYIATKTKP